MVPIKAAGNCCGSRARTLRAGHGHGIHRLFAAWDEKAYFATAVGTNVPSEIPVVGNVVKEVMRGGSELGTLTISRFFVAHVFMIPGLIFLDRYPPFPVSQSGSAAGPRRSIVSTQSFPPRASIPAASDGPRPCAARHRDLGSLALLYPAVLGPEANPADTQFLPRPEWYFRSLFQWLKLWTGSSAVVGIGVVPLIVVVLFVGLPFIDRRAERRPWKRPLAVGLFALIFGGLIIIEGWSYYADAHDAAVAKQLALQDQQTKDYMQEPFKPERQGSACPYGTGLHGRLSGRAGRRRCCLGSRRGSRTKNFRIACVQCVPWRGRSGHLDGAQAERESGGSARLNSCSTSSTIPPPEWIRGACRISSSHQDDVQGAYRLPRQSTIEQPKAVDS